MLWSAAACVEDTSGPCRSFQHAVGVPLSRSKQVQEAQRSRFHSLKTTKKQLVSFF